MLVLVQLFFRDDIERMRMQCKLTCKYCTLWIEGSVMKNECVDCFNRLEAEGFQPLNTAYNGVVPFLRCYGLE